MKTMKITVLNDFFHAGEAREVGTTLEVPYLLGVELIGMNKAAKAEADESDESDGTGADAGDNAAPKASGGKKSA